MICNNDSVLTQIKKTTQSLWKCYENPNEFDLLRNTFSENLCFLGTQQDELFLFLRESSDVALQIINITCEAQLLCCEIYMAKGFFDAQNSVYGISNHVSIPYTAVYQYNSKQLVLIGLHTVLPSEREAKAVFNNTNELLNQYQTELEKALNYKYAFETENDLTFEVELPSRAVCLNKTKFAMLFDTSEERLKQYDPHYLIISSIMKEDRDRYSKWWHISFRGTNEEKLQVRSIEFRAKTPKNMYVWYKTTITPVVSGNQIVKLIGRIKNINERKLKEQHLKKLSSKDSLTGLYNRRYTEILIEKYLTEDGRPGTLMMIDLDNFKKVNDLYGHLEGDKTLLEVASILTGVCGARDIIGRIGGDEFIVFLRNTADKKAISDKAEQIINALNYGIDGFGDGTKATATIGISIFPFDGQRFTALWSHADDALYRMKNQGKNTYGFYNESF